MNVGTKLRAIRKSKSVTVQAVADILGVGHSTVENWEGGRREPTLDMIQRYGEAIGVTIELTVSDAKPIGELREPQKALYKAFMSVLPDMTDDEADLQLAVFLRLAERLAARASAG